jgi:outer membrane protein TolC
LTGAELGPQIQAGGGASFNDSDAGSLRSYRASASIGYELDLWGKADALRDAATLEARATEEDRRALALSTIGSAATLYWQLGLLNTRIASSNASLAYAERTRDLVRAQYNAGAVSRLEMEDAEQAVQSQRAAHTRLIQSRAESRLAMGLLRDGRPWPEADEPQSLPSGAPAVEAGAPAALLARRPDLRAGEMRLRSMLASNDASRLSFYPSMSLTGSYGGSSESLTRVLADPVSTLAAALSLPFLQVNQMRLSNRISEAQYEEARLSFRQTLRRALAEVESTLSARTQLAAQGAELEASLDAAVTAERLYEARYRAGAATLRVWLDAQERRRQAELAVEQNRYDQLANLVSLYLALGGTP